MPSNQEMDKSINQTNNSVDDDGNDDECLCWWRHQLTTVTNTNEALLWWQTVPCLFVYLFVYLFIYLFVYVPLRRVKTCEGWWWCPCSGVEDIECFENDWLTWVKVGYVFMSADGHVPKNKLTCSCV